MDHFASSEITTAESLQLFKQQAHLKHILREITTAESLQLFKQQAHLKHILRSPTGLNAYLPQHPPSPSVLGMKGLGSEGVEVLGHTEGPHLMQPQAWKDLVNFEIHTDRTNFNNKQQYSLLSL
ncbi:hypothetical protein DPMN_184207 [Dreissena polymorpha]|uniref:Uncharacterized protein n=1 Tax=Dreissena polymorpha TaxID=45954 RepID=A0A9D4DJ33_DREPO|nr:hypothetical protein DPMN_184207 [Dreissena polymorpha]